MNPGGDVTVTFGGNTLPLSQAVTQATGELTRFAQQANQTNQQLGQLNSSAGTAHSQMTALGSVVQELGGHFNYLQMAITQTLTNAVMQGFDLMIAKAQEFGQEMLQLSIQTESNAYSWRFLYGGGYASPDQGKGVSKSLMDWTRKFSYEIPFTRQDLMGAITAMAPTGMNVSQVETIMPMIADLMATQGNPNISPTNALRTAALAIQHATMGNSRMLMYDLNMRAGDLEAAGFDPNDAMNTLIPALQKYTSQRHLTGAAKGMATETWKGAWSSFLDRIQNFQIDAADKAFQLLKSDLNSITDWWDSHQADINRFADVLGTHLAGALRAVGQAAGEFISGAQGNTVSTMFGEMGAAAAGLMNTLSGIGQGQGNLLIGMLGGVTQSGGLKAIKDIFTSIGDALKNPNVQATLQWIGLAIGTVAGDGLKILDGLISNIKTFADSQSGQAIWTVLKNIGDTLGNIGRTLEHFAPLLNLIGSIIQFVMNVALYASVAITAVLDVMSKIAGAILSWIGDRLSDALHFGENFVHAIGDGIGRAAGWFKDRLGDLAGTIGNIFHHSTPSEGPLHGDDQWMPDMVRGWADQIRAGVPQIQAASMSVAQAMQHGVQGNVATANSQTNAYTTNYGDSAATLNVYTSDDARIARIVQQVINQNNATGNLQIRQSGGYNRYGALAIG